MSNFRRVIEYIKTAVIAILIISAVCLFVAYMFEFQSISENHAIAFDKMRVLSGADSSALYDITSDCIFPSSFAYSCDGNKRLFTGSRSLYYTAYSEALSYIQVMCSSSSYCAVISENAGEVWDYCTGKDFVYLLYQDPLPISVLCLFSGNFESGVEDTVQGELPYAREIFIINSDNYLASAFTRSSGIIVSPNSGDICAAVRDADGKVYLIFCVSAHYDVKFDKVLFSAYNKNESVCDFYFLKETDAQNRLDGVFGTFSDTVIIPKKGITLTDIVTVNHTSHDFSDDSVLKFLEDIGINTTKMRHYEGTEGDAIYISESFVFRISSDGVITYQATGDEGIPLSEVLGYSKASGNYSLFDSLTAASRFLACIKSDLGASYFGDNVLSQLMTECVYENGSLTLEYCYGVNGIRMNGEKGAAITISNGSITYAELRTLSAETGNNRKKLEPAIWVIETAAGGGAFDGEKSLYGLNVVYAVKDGRYTPEWEVTSR